MRTNSLPDQSFERDSGGRDDTESVRALGRRPNLTRLSPNQGREEAGCQLGKLSIRTRADLRTGQRLDAESISRDSPFGYLLTGTHRARPVLPVASVWPRADHVDMTDGLGYGILFLPVVIVWSKWVTRATAHITTARARMPWVIRNPIRALAWAWPLLLFFDGIQLTWLSWAVLLVPPALATVLVFAERAATRGRV
jgi:hypothetical protein